jgi:glucose/arabinose dehydrogenase
MLIRRGVCALAALGMISASEASGENAPAPRPAAAPARPPVDPCAPSQYANDTYFPPSAFPGQTRAPRTAPSAPFNIEVFATGLEHPWSAAFLPDGRMLVTERPGRMRIIGKDGKLSAPIANVPAIEKVQLAGLHDVLLDKDFARNRILYFNYYTRAPGQTEEPGKPLLGVGRTVRARLSAKGDALEDLKVIHEGGLMRRLVRAPDGTLMATSGTGATGGPGPQALDDPGGKVMRFNTDGTIPKNNPFVGDPKALPEIYARGFRDPEGAAINPATGEMWTVENGPRGGDELNRIKKGGNYGFAEISYGREYSGALINGGLTAKDGMEQPVYYWLPSIAPSGLMFYTGALFPKWKGSLFAGSLVGKHIVRLEMKDGKVTAEESLMGDRCTRYRDIRQGPEGAIYILTDMDMGEVLRLTPRK